MLIICVTLHNARLRTLSCNPSLYCSISLRRLSHLNLKPVSDRGSSVCEEHPWYWLKGLWGFYLEVLRRSRLYVTLC